MKLLVLVNLLLALLSGHTESSALLQSLQTFTLEELVPLRAEFFPEKLEVQWVSDTEYIFRDYNIGIQKYDATTDNFTTILDEEFLFNLRNYSLSTFSPNTKYTLLTTNREKMYRYSNLAEYAILNFDNSSIQTLDDGPLQIVAWSPLGNSLAYVKDNNVYYVPDVTELSKVHTLTTEGVPGEVYFGAADWTYEEEIFNAAEALWFSTNGTYLAVASFNDTNVESTTYPIYGDPFNIENQYTKMIEFKYPKAGRTNPVVGLQVFYLNNPLAEPWIIPAPVDVVGLDHILGSVRWASDQNLVVLWLNRRQNVSVVINCDLKKDKCSISNKHNETNGWIDISNQIFDSTGTKMVEIQPLFNGEHRFKHASRFDFNTLTTEDLSPGNSTVTEILGWNHELDTVYYLVAPRSSPWLRQMWATSSGVVRCVTCKESSCRHVSASFSPKSSFAIVTCGACNIPPKTFLYDTKADNFKLIKDNNKLAEKLNNYKLPMTLFNVLSAGNIFAHVELLLPPEILTGYRYPMIVRVYAGPGTSRVKDNYNLEYYNTYLAANRSFIVASIDVRGSEVMGVEALHAVNNALGTVEITDTLAAIRSLVSVYPFIDPERIGVWGWSYGGFASTMMLMNDHLKMIRCGAAVAPVTSWLYYDTIYTERYMGTPQENPFSYQRSDLIASAELLRGKRYLLVHGSGDDNVHYQNSMQLAKELQHADIPFEQMSYTDETHSLFGVSRHFYHTLDHFWTECFYP